MERGRVEGEEGERVRAGEANEFNSSKSFHIKEVVEESGRKICVCVCVCLCVCVCVCCVLVFSERNETKSGFCVYMITIKKGVYTFI